MQVLNILIVDDEAELRKNVASVLQNQIENINCKISEATNGKEAVSMIHQNNFDS